MNLTGEEVVVSLPLDLTTDEDLLDGWQEIRACYFRDYLHGQKTTVHRLKATITVMRNSSQSFGEVFVWASSTWKTIFRANYSDLPSIDLGAVNKRESYADAVDWLFVAGSKVVG